MLYRAVAAEIDIKNPGSYFTHVLILNQVITHVTSIVQYKCEL